MTVTRPKKFTLLLAEEEKTMLEWLSDAEGMDASTYLRTHIRCEYTARQSEGRPYTRTPKGGAAGTAPSTLTTKTYKTKR